jgi:hypothetical protein
LQAGVHVASRTGALNEIEYSEFVAAHPGDRRGDPAPPPIPQTCSDVMGAWATQSSERLGQPARDAQLAVAPAMPRERPGASATSAACAAPRLRARRRARSASSNPSTERGRAAGPDPDLRFAGSAGRRAGPRRGARRHALVRRAANRSGAEPFKAWRPRPRPWPSAWDAVVVDRPTSGRSAARASPPSAGSSAS